MNDRKHIAPEALAVLDEAVREAMRDRINGPDLDTFTLRFLLGDGSLLTARARAVLEAAGEADRTCTGCDDPCDDGFYGGACPKAASAWRAIRRAYLGTETEAAPVVMPNRSSAAPHGDMIVNGDALPENYREIIKQRVAEPGSTPAEYTRHDPYVDPRAIVVPAKPPCPTCGTIGMPGSVVLLCKHASYFQGTSAFDTTPDRSSIRTVGAGFVCALGRDTSWIARDGCRDFFPIMEPTKPACPTCGGSKRVRCPENAQCGDRLEDDEPCPYPEYGGDDSSLCTIPCPTCGMKGEGR